eukprot:TRINITY_DN17241_c0_g1_i1.p1 TRINITY_DN17241_c0_g1~~TRINITY_DN17241_c0_g1_i1.p1  ORF type:complete len:196 (+),score=52.94 TRINITY_DN17241_c0_g1_i1:60-590(+)
MCIRDSFIIIIIMTEDQEQGPQIYEGIFQRRASPEENIVLATGFSIGLLVTGTSFIFINLIPKTMAAILPFIYFVIRTQSYISINLYSVIIPIFMAFLCLIYLSERSTSRIILKEHLTNQGDLEFKQLLLEIAEGIILLDPFTDEVIFKNEAALELLGLDGKFHSQTEINKQLPRK